MIEIIPNWHPIFVHFTVAFLVLCGVLQLALWLSKPVAQHPSADIIQKWLVGLASVAVIATVATGLQAYYSVNHDSPSHLAMTNHRNWAFATATVFILGALVFFTAPRLRQSIAGACFVGALILVSTTAFKGGEVVYRYGLGVMSLPKVTGEGHDHGEGKGHDQAKPEQPTKTEAHKDDGSHEHGADSGHSEDPVVTPKPATEEHSHAQGGHSHDKSDPLKTGLESDAAKAVIAFHTAINTGDAAKARALLDDAVLIFEGGGVERSGDQYANHHMKSDMAFMQQMKITRLEHQVKVIGNAAVSMSRAKIQGRYKNKDIDINSMETMMLIKNNGHWRIVHIHWSN
ncbi:MAG: DUF4440 domain-containing protein [Algicola sp.]|nr:DUF4440 domain-containing protein [Algicola sp.]